VIDFLQQIAWRPGIGDPTVMGWVTVAAYALAAFAAWRTAESAEAQTSEHRTWVLVTVLMGMLCINKQLDLQSLFTDIARFVARKQGWYERHREVQLWFVILVPVTAAVATGVLALRYRAFWRRHWLLGTGLAFLLTFVVVRAISFHHVDQFLGWQLAGVTMNRLLELTGIALVLAAALRECQIPGGIAGV
jgi:hypothetical protein